MAPGSCAPIDARTDSTRRDMLYEMLTCRVAVQRRHAGCLHKNVSSRRAAARVQTVSATERGSLLPRWRKMHALSNAAVSADLERVARSSRLAIEPDDRLTRPDRGV